MRTGLSDRAIDYAWGELLRRAGAGANGPRESSSRLGVTFHYGEPSEVPPNVPAIVVRRSHPVDWARLLELPEGGLESVPLRDALPIGADGPSSGSLPMLLRARGATSDAEFARIEGSAVIFECDLLASVLFLLTRWEETALTARDRHGRLPYSESVAWRQGFLDRPLVDEYALVLREWLRVLRPGWTPAARRFSVKLSHDIDVVGPFWSLGRAARSLAGDLVRGKDPGRTVANAGRAMMQGIAPRRTPDYEAIFRLAEISRRHEMASAFFLMAAEPGPFDSAYDVSSRPIRDAIRRLRDLGCEIGFHPGYATFDNPGRLAQEKARLDGVLGGGRYGGRQHYLRFRAPETWREWERLGLAYDSTLTWAGHEGFRCGTCHPYRPFDLEADRVLDIEEVPLIVMDGTLRQYRALTAAEAEARVLELARRCRDVEGTFTLLWHNSSLTGEWAAWGFDYEGVVAKLSEMQGRARRLHRPTPISTPREAARTEAKL